MIISLLRITKDQRLDPEFYSYHPSSGKEEVPLAQVADITLGTTPKISVSGEIPFYKVENIKKFQITDAKWHIAKNEIEKKRIARKGDILVTIKGRVGDAAMLDHAAFHNQDVARIFAWKIHPLLLVSILNSEHMQKQMQKIATNQMHPYIRLDDIRKIRIPVISKRRANNICEIASSIKQTTAELKKYKDKIEKIFLTTKRTGPSRIYFQDIKRSNRLDAEFFTNGLGTEISKKTLYIKDLKKINIRIGMYVKNYHAEGIPYIRGKNVRGGKIIPDAYTIGDNKDVTQKNEILITRVGNLKATCIKNEKFIASDNFLRLRYDDSRVLPQIIVCYLNSKAGQNEIERHMQGSKQRRINKRNLLNVHVPMLDKNESKKIISQMEKIESLTRIKDRKIQKLQKVILQSI